MNRISHSVGADLKLVETNASAYFNAAKSDATMADSKAPDHITMVALRKRRSLTAIHPYSFRTVTVPLAVDTCTDGPPPTELLIVCVRPSVSIFTDPP